MAAIRETLYAFTANASQLIAELKKIDRAVEKVPSEKVTTIRAETEKAIADLEKFEGEVKAAFADNPEVIPILNLRRLVKDVAKAKTVLASLPEDKTVDLELKGLDLQENKIDAQMDQLRETIRRKTEQIPAVEAEFTARTEQFDAQIERAEKKLDLLNKKRNKTVEIKANIREAEAKLEVLRARADKFAESNPTVKIEADIGTAMAQLALIEERKNAIGRKREEIKIDIDRTAGARIANAREVVGGLITSLGTATNKAGDAASAFANFSNVWGGVSQSLRRVAPLLSGVAIILFATLVPAFLAVGLAAVGAIGAIGALATAFTATLIPAVIGAIGVMSRFGAVSDSMQAFEQMNEQAVKSTANAQERAAQKAATLQSARQGLADATRGVARAEDALQEARRGAREDIAQAEERYHDALADNEDAVRDVADATVDAYREIRDAIEAAEDAQLSYKRALLGQEQASLNIDKAKLALEEFKEEAGNSGNALDKLFKKFTDVSVDTSGIRDAIDNAVGGKAGLDKGQKLELEQLILDVRDAKLGEEEATDRVNDAETTLNDTTAEANRLRKEGIKGVDGYRSALDRVADTADAAGDAQKDYNRLVKLGVTGAPAVVAAQEALADAVRNRARQSQGLASTQKKLAGGDAALLASRANFIEQFGKLSSAEREWQIALQRLKEGGRDLASDMSGPVFTALTNLIDGFKGAAPLIRAKAIEIGEAWGDVIDKFTQDFHMPTGIFDLKGIENLLKLRGILDGTIALTKTFGDIARNAFGLFLNLALAALPHLEKLTEDFSAWVKGLRDGSGNIKGISDSIGPAVETLRNFGKIGLNAVTGVWNAFEAGSGPINDFLKWIGDALKGFSDWAGSAKGKNTIKEFFEDVLPFVKSFIKFVVKIAKAFLIAFKIFAPILKPIIDMFNSFLDIFTFVLKIVDAILGPFKTLIGILLSMFIPFGRVAQAAGALVKAGVKLLPFLGRLGPVFGKVAGILRGSFSKAWNFVVGLFKSVWGILRKAVRGGAQIIVNAFSTYLKLFLAPWRWVVARIKTVFNGVWTAIKFVWDKVKVVFNGVVDFFRGKVKVIGRIFKAIASSIEDAFDGTLDFLEGVFDGIWGAFKKIINLLIGGLNTLIGGLNKLEFKLPSWVPGVGGKGFEINIPKIPKLAGGGVTRGGTFAEIGEAGREAILPLTRAVYAELARGIVQAMSPLIGRARVATAGATVGGATIVHKTVVEKIVIETADGALPDATATAVKLARVLERRGGGPRQ